MIVQRIREVVGKGGRMVMVYDWPDFTPQARVGRGIGAQLHKVP